MTTKTYYEVLEVMPTATQEQIQDAYRFKAAAYHTDKFPKGSNNWQMANEKMKEINVAYDVLKVPSKRQGYDKGLKRQAISSEEQERIKQERKERASEARRQKHESESKETEWKSESIFTDEQLRAHSIREEQERHEYRQNRRQIVYVIAGLVFFIAFIAFACYKQWHQYDTSKSTTNSVVAATTNKQVNKKQHYIKLNAKDKETLEKLSGGTFFNPARDNLPSPDGKPSVK